MFRSQPKIPNGKFDYGTVLATPGAIEVMQELNIDPWQLILRHVAGDWGDMCDTDKNLNDMAVTGKDRILSSYIVKPGTKNAKEVKLWVITEWDRSVTTILTPDEY